eukprot:6528888-Pyramimonas_sp.AAC.1
MRKRSLTYGEFAWRRTQPHAVVNTVVVSIAFGGSPYGATKRVKSVPKLSGSFMRALLLGLDVEPP